MMADGGFFGLFSKNKLKVGDILLINPYNLPPMRNGSQYFRVLPSTKLRVEKITDDYFIRRIGIDEGSVNDLNQYNKEDIDTFLKEGRLIKEKMADGGMMADGGLSDQLDVVRKQRDLAEYYEKNEKNYQNNYGHRIITAEELAKVKQKVDGFLNPLGYSATIEKSIGDVLYVIEPSTRKVGNNRSDFFDGMQILAMEDGTFEVSEYQAGKNENELYIYKITNSLITALKDLIKGNKREPIKKYADGGMMAKGGRTGSKIKDWYTKTYPTDELGQEINDSITFKGLWAMMSQGYDVYEVLGVGDSIVRERVFEKLSEILGVDYSVVYDEWLDGGKKRRMSLLNNREYADGGMMADGGEVDEELIRASAKSIYDHFGGMMELRNKFLQLANTDEKYGDIETANLRRKIVKEYQDKQPKMMADGGMADGGMMAKGGVVYSKDGYVKSIRDADGKLIKEIVNGGKKYRYNSVYKTYNSVEGNELLHKTTYADGGMMADGGEIKVGDFVTINGRKTKILDTYTDKSFGTKTIYLVNVPIYEGVKNSPMTKSRYIKDDQTGELRKIEKKDFV